MKAFGRELPPGSVAWGVAGLLFVLFMLALLGVFNFRTGPKHDELMYKAIADDLRSNAQPGEPLRMELEADYPGPLQDTTIQRWRDPVDGTVCYIYLPRVVPHSPGTLGMVQYGAATIGSISCLPPQK